MTDAEISAALDRIERALKQAQLAIKLEAWDVVRSLMIEIRQIGKTLPPIKWTPHDR